MIDVGSVRLQVLHTPGHRPEHCALTVIDTPNRPSRWRCSPATACSSATSPAPIWRSRPRVGARDLHRSLERLAALPDSVEVLPAHIGGSLCGSARMSTDTRSTIGAQRRHNQMFVNPDEDAFVAELTSGLSPQPPNFKRIVARNRGPLEAHDDPAEAVDAGSAARLQQAGAVVIDGRGVEPFDHGHIPGSVGVPAGVTGFATKVAWIVDPEREVILVGADTAQAETMAMALHAVAVDRTLVLDRRDGCLGGCGLSTSLRGNDRRRRARAAMARGRCPAAGCARARRVGRVPDAGLASTCRITSCPARLGRLDPARPIACICSGGTRSGVAVGLLQRDGLDCVHVVDGVEVWRHLGFPLEFGAVAA